MRVDGGTASVRVLLKTFGRDSYCLQCDLSLRAFCIPYVEKRIFCRKIKNKPKTLLGNWLVFTLIFKRDAYFVAEVSVPAFGAYLVPFFFCAIKVNFVKLHAIHKCGISDIRKAIGKCDGSKA